MINAAISDNNMEVQIAVAGQSANNISDTFPLSSIMYRHRYLIRYLCVSPYQLPHLRCIYTNQDLVFQLWALKMLNGTYLEN